MTGRIAVTLDPAQVKRIEAFNATYPADSQPLVAQGSNGRVVEVDTLQPHSFMCGGYHTWKE